MSGDFYIPVSARREILDFENAYNSSIDKFIGFPVAMDGEFSEIAPLFSKFMNNIGDPMDNTSLSSVDCKKMEREVIDFFAQLLHAPEDGYWGYVTSGSTEGNLYGLYTARECHPEGVVYYTDASHYSIAKNVHILRMKSEVVRTQSTGEMDYEHLLGQLKLHNKPAIIVANIGTTMTEALDDVVKIKGALKQAGVKEFYIHSDAAMAGAYAGFIEPRHPFDFANGADSITISGYKFLPAPMPCGIVLVRKKIQRSLGERVAYIENPDVTISGSRSGHAPLCMWYGIRRWGAEGFRARYRESMQLAEYATQELVSIGWKAWRNPYAITVVLAAPPEKLRYEWQLATHNGWSHIVCAPGRKKEQIDAFVQDLKNIKVI